MKTSAQKRNLKILLFILIIYLLTFQDVIQQYIQIFKYFDEFLAVLVFPMLIIKIRKNKNLKIKKNHLIMILLLGILVISGLYANIMFKYQSLKFVLSDMILVLKFFMAYFLGNMLLSEEFINNNKSKINKHIKLIVYFLFTCTILNYIFNIWTSKSIRFGIMANKLFYGHQTSLAAASIFLLALLELTRENEKKAIMPMICIFIVLISTLRLKAIGATCIIIIMMMYIHKTKKKITLSKIIILGTLAIIIAHDQIFYYFIDIDQSARKQLVMKSIQIIKDFFPVGTGFATFGSYYSSISYSPVYYIYNLTNIQGLTPDAPAFVSDTFWPIIFGQFGILGAICYICCIILIFKNIQENFSKININMYVSKLICLIYLLISSTSEAAFMHTIAIPLALIIGIRVSSKKNNEEQTR